MRRRRIDRALHHAADEGHRHRRPLRRRARHGRHRRASPTEHGLPIIEDAAQAIGSHWQDRPAGTLGDIGTFSFHGTKTLTTGEGGMLVTDDDDLFDAGRPAPRSRTHGR